MNFKKLTFICLAFTAAYSSQAQQIEELTKHEQTEYYEPKVRKVDPAKQVGDAPADAIVLFDGKNFDKWERADSALHGSPVGWKINTDGSMTVVGGKKNIRTKQEFNDFQLHIEWQSPIEDASRQGQGRGNSGVFMQERYEVQVLNSRESETYSNGQAASIYKQTTPLVNACRKEGEWNTYDIIYSAPRFRKNGSLEKAPYITVIHNGIIVQNHFEIQGTTEYIGPPKWKAHGKGAIELQDHGNAVSYRNIWIREL
jgi:Domain of Unknown Function (DUF1080)